MLLNGIFICDEGILKNNNNPLSITWGTQDGEGDCLLAFCLWQFHKSLVTGNRKKCYVRKRTRETPSSVPL